MTFFVAHGIVIRESHEVRTNAEDVVHKATKYRKSVRHGVQKFKVKDKRNNDSL